MSQSAPSTSPPYDVIIIGGGISGLIFLKYAKEKKLKVLLLEKEAGGGGIWRKLPAWQDIQTPIEDWAINDTPIQGPTQPHILANILSWIDQFKLRDQIRFDTEVTGTSFENGHWVCRTQKEHFSSKYLVVATGLHNKPRLPQIPRAEVEVREIHSSQLFDLSVLNVRRLAVIGGSASAFDILEKALEREVPEIHWITGTLSWMTPSRQAKTKKRSLRLLAASLIRAHEREVYNAGIKQRLIEKYRYFQIEELIPEKDPDLWRHAVVNGRPLLISNLKKITRHPGHLTGINKNKIKVGAVELECDLVVYATGYDLDLSFLGLDRVSAIRTRPELQRRCGTAVKSLDYPNLFFVGPTLLDTNSSTPFYSATFAKTIVAHILGKTVIPDEVALDNVPHWAVIRRLAEFDRYNYSRWFWRVKYFFLAWYYNKYPEKQLKV